MTKTKILIGCDPELFVVDKDKFPVSAHDLIAGDKLNPSPVPNGAIQKDGVAAEFNILPADSENDFVLKISCVRQHLLDAVQKKNKDYILVAKPTMKFTRRQWADIPWDAKQLGCEPDYSAYSPNIPNTPPQTTKFMRTGSGHVHVSWGRENIDYRDDTRYRENISTLIWHFDKHLYPNSLIWDKDKERQELYGKQGAFRPKPYGVEYRTLSNAWLNDEKTMRFVYRTTVQCTRNWLDGANPNDYAMPRFEG